jgi:hypothetical protein
LDDVAEGTAGDRGGEIERPDRVEHARMLAKRLRRVKEGPPPAPHH